MTQTDAAVLTAVAAAIQAGAALVNVAVVVWLVRVTKRYVDETAVIATGTQEAATAAQRSAEAAGRAAAISERQVLESRRPYILVTHVSVSTYTEASHKPRGRDRAVPQGFSINVQNEGFGPIAWLDAALVLGGTAFNCDFGNLPHRRLPVGSKPITLRFEAHETDLEPFFEMREIAGDLRFEYTDASGVAWRQACPVTVYEDHSSAHVGPCTVRRLTDGEP